MYGVRSRTRARAGGGATNARILNKNILFESRSVPGARRPPRAITRYRISGGDILEDRGRRPHIVGEPGKRGMDRDEKIKIK